MSWAKLDDGFFDNPKVMELSWGARGVWVTSLSWCARKLTDGRISTKATRLLEFPQEFIRELVATGLWEPANDGNGWVLHDYLEYNMTREKVLALREAGKQRVARYAAQRKSSPPAGMCAASQEADDTSREGIALLTPVPDPDPDPRSNSRSQDLAQACARPRYERIPVGDPPPDLPPPPPPPLAPAIRVWRLYEKVGGFASGQLGVPGTQLSACQKIADSVAVEAGESVGNAFDDAVQRLLTVWQADAWVAENCPKLKHLAENLPKFSGQRGLRLVGRPGVAKTGFRPGAVSSTEEIARQAEDNPDWIDAEVAL